jgi:hypothetical protein
VNPRLLIQACVLTACVATTTALAQKTPPRPSPPTPRVHHSACELAESMASRLADKAVIEPARAQQTCQMLMPTMKPADAADFMRCCVNRLTKGAAAPPKPSGKTAPDPRQGT